jgi:Ca-activated chloride channel family protein
MKMVKFIKNRLFLRARNPGYTRGHTAVLCYLSSVLFCSASAQTATELFNPAAKEFIYGNTPVASNLVNQALMKFPDNKKLQKLKKLIEEQQQDQDQKNQDQNQNQNKDQNKDQNQDQKNDQDQKNQNPNQDQQNQDQQQQDQQTAQPKQAGEMSPEEAQQLLDAMKQNEKDQRANLTPYLGAPVRVDKDW